MFALEDARDYLRGNLMYPEFLMVRAAVSIALLFPAMASAQSLPDAWYVAQASQAASTCITDSGVQRRDLEATVEVASICIAGGFIRDVWLDEVPHCPGNQSCPDAEPVAVVQFGCDDELVIAECLAATTCWYDGSSYSVGESFDATDGCNTCICGETGLAGCTKIACAQ